MSYSKDLSLLQEFIENFDPEEFSSSEDFINTLPPTQRIEKARRLKGKIQRKRELAAKFSESLSNLDLDDTDVLITQDQIDELLAGKV